jgi:hypothetical protein
VDLTTTSLKNNQKLEQQLMRNFTVVREEGRWKYGDYVPAENDLASALVNAGTQDGGEGCWPRKKTCDVSIGACLVGRQGAELLLVRGNFSRRRLPTAWRNSLAEQIGGQAIEPAAGLLYLGNVYRSQGNYAEPSTYLQKSKAIVEGFLVSQSRNRETMNSTRLPPIG